MVFHSEPGYVGPDTYDVLPQHVVSHHFRFAEGKEATLFCSPHCYIWPVELDLMAQLAGFELETRHADWSGTEFAAVSARMGARASDEHGPGSSRLLCGMSG